MTGVVIACDELSLEEHGRVREAVISVAPDLRVGEAENRWRQPIDIQGLGDAASVVAATVAVVSLWLQVRDRKSSAGARDEMDPAQIVAYTETVLGRYLPDVLRKELEGVVAADELPARIQVSYGRVKYHIEVRQGSVGYLITGSLERLETGPQPGSARGGQPDD